MLSVTLKLMRERLQNSIKLNNLLFIFAITIVVKGGYIKISDTSGIFSPFKSVLLPLIIPICPIRNLTFDRPKP